MSEVLEKITKIIEKKDDANSKKLENITAFISEYQNLELKTIRELKGYHFIVPSYQRGYKWKSQQVEDLLNDIQNFAEKSEKVPEEFYSLQPVVVKKNGENWDLIDGQQRLTTIFILLKYLKLQEGVIFKLSYNTRDKSSAFLDNIVNANKEGKDNIDTYFFYNAYETIEKWFEKKNDEEKDTWKETLLNETKIIWYHAKTEANSEEIKDSIAIFSRLNSGKIPLTNSELIRALFLHNSKSNKDDELSSIKQSKIADKWDNIEQGLHNEDFWGFITLNNPFNKKYPNRIEFIFDLIEAKSKDKTKVEENDRYSTFRMYEKNIKNGDSIQVLWQEVIEYYYRFHEWFIDDDLYHLVGYVTLCKIMELKDILDNANTDTQTKLVITLKEKIKDEFKDLYDKEKDEINLDSLNYEKSNDKILNLLKLFNVYTYMKEGTRCPFTKYVNTPWSLEHIYAQNSLDLNDEKWKEWAETESQGYENILSNKKGDNIKDLKEEFTKKVEELFSDSYEMHNIGNLALLSSSDNSSLGNKVFPNKRKAILMLVENKEKFIPIATRNTFLKYYTEEVSQMQKWSKKDFEDYRSKIKECIEYFKKKVTNNG